MYVWYQMFIFVVVIYRAEATKGRPGFITIHGNVPTNEIDNCDCDVLQINSPVGLFGNQSFTKQNDTRNGKPIYVSTQRNMISWNNHYWSYDKYNAHLEIFESLKNYSTNLFSFERMCQIKDVTLKGNIILRWIIQQYYQL